MADIKIKMALELNPCPFCGSTKLKIENKTVFSEYSELFQRIERVTYSVRCNSCHARGGTAGGIILYPDSTMRLPEWATTVTELQKRAIEAWNRRDYK